MPTFSIHNFGCRATQADADAIEGALVSRGYHRLAADDLANLVVLNTCTVTAAADAQTRDAIRKIHRANPLARIVVTGCYAQRAPEELASIPGVSWVVGNSHQAEIPRIVAEEFVPALAMRRSRPLYALRPPREIFIRFRASIPTRFRSSPPPPRFLPETFSRRSAFHWGQSLAEKATAPGPS